MVIETNEIIASGLSALTQTLHIFFGAAEAKMSYAGLLSGLVSVYQFNVEIPNVTESDLVPVTFTLGATPSLQTVYAAVQR